MIGSTWFENDAAGPKYAAREDDGGIVGEVVKSLDCVPCEAARSKNTDPGRSHVCIKYRIYVHGSMFKKARNFGT